MSTYEIHHTEQTRERPILFSGEMVRAIIAGAKTQTRRIVLPRAVERLGLSMVSIAGRVFPDVPAAPIQHSGCPYGVPGDRLWVRETWRTHERPSDSVDGIEFAADLGFREIANTRAAADLWAEANDNGRHRRMWRPSIFMPRWASRITLEVTGVRGERLQDISNDDARAEGVAEWNGDEPGDYRGGFRDLWDKINGKRAPWESNPWVWRIEFRRSQP